MKEEQFFKNYFMLTTNGIVFQSLKQYLHLYHINLFPLEFNLLGTHQAFIAEFNRIVKCIETKIDNDSNTVVFIDHGSSTLTSDDELNPLIFEDSKGLPQFISMLILVFPEVHWIFMPGISTTNLRNNENDETEMVNTKVKQDSINIHTYNINDLKILITTILDFSNSNLAALFDPCKLRNIIKQNINNMKDLGERLPIRKLCAAAIDEEISYALMNAYTAYRFGYRTWVITTLGTMEHVFGNKNYDVKLILEDLYLNFPDKDRDIHLSKLKRRDEKFPGLTVVNERILITVGHKNTNETKNTWLCNLRYLKSKFNGRYKILYKPLSGIFDFWKKAGKWKPFSNIPKLAKDFYWPPEQNPTRGDEYDCHSAPGRLLLISEKLLKRSKRILKDSGSVTDAIHAATLALEAKELLACKTPTVSLEALSLQHQAEVEAECMFYGVEYNLDVKSRIKDIKKEIGAISKWFHPSSRKRSQLNAEITILSVLAQQYRKYNQFDEENICLHENRKLTNTLWAIRNPCNPLRLLGWLFKYYINFLLKSLTRFAIVILFWVFLFGIIFWCKANGQPNTNVEFIDSVIVSAKTFLAFQPLGLEFWVPYQAPEIGHISTPIRLAWFIGPAVLGFIHLGVFISHLTMILMRKPGG